MVERYSVSRIPDFKFGAGTIHELPEIISRFGKHIILVTGGASFKIIDERVNIISSLQKQGIIFSQVEIRNEPSPAMIDRVTDSFRTKKIEVVVSVGGGSVLDAGKAISAMLKVESDTVDFLEGVGSKEHPGIKIPFIAVPTTAGTGSEATKNAVISEPGEKGFKKSLRHANFVPDFAVIDPVLTVSCSPEITASSGLDAFTQLTESYLSTQANPFTDALAIEGIGKVMHSLEKAYADGNNLQARMDMAYASFLSGITLANAGLGVVHGFAQPLGCLFPIPHGVVCASLMAITNQVTLKKLLSENSSSVAVKKYIKLGQLAGSSVSGIESADYFIEYITGLTQRFQLPRLSEFGVCVDDFRNIIGNTGQKNHPVKLNNDELTEILKSRM